MKQEWMQYFKENEDRFLSELSSWLAIPSISVGATHREDARRAAEWLAGAMRDGGLEHVAVLETDGLPVVYADWLHAQGKPTALVYGHYDVQPADDPALWTTPAFAPQVRDGKLFARGATDDKGQLFLHIKVVEALLRTEGTLPVNVKFCIEGEEEIASPSLPAFLEKETERLQADVVVISDSPMQGKNKPSIQYGLRGLCAVQLEVSGPKHDLHSGIYGGGVANPIHALTGLLAGLHDSEGRVAVAGFYDDVPELSEAERTAIRALQHDDEAVKREIGVDKLYGEAGYTFLERTTARPTLEIHTITGGYQGGGIKPVVPSSAIAMLSCRLVGGQSPDRIMELLEKHVEANKPSGVTVKLTRLLKGRPFAMPLDHPYLLAAATAYQDAFGIAPVFTRSGGSIPIVEVFARLLQAPVLLMGFGLPEENMHGPDEHFHLDSLQKGLLTLCSFMHRLAEAGR